MFSNNTTTNTQAVSIRQGMAITDVLLRSAVTAYMLYEFTNNDKLSLSAGACVFALNLYIKQYTGQLPGKILPIKDALDFMCHKAERCAEDVTTAVSHCVKFMSGN